MDERELKQSSGAIMKLLELLVLKEKETSNLIMRDELYSSIRSLLDSAVRLKMHKNPYAYLIQYEQNKFKVITSAEYILELNSKYPRKIPQVI